MSDETTDSPSKWDSGRAVGVFTLIVILAILAVAIYGVMHIDDDADDSDDTEFYLNQSIYDLNYYGGTIYFGDSDSIYVPAKSTLQVKDGMIRVTYQTTHTGYTNSGAPYDYYETNTDYGSISQITYISINPHR